MLPRTEYEIGENGGGAVAGDSIETVRRT